MTTKQFTSLRLSDQDLNFLVEAAAPGVGDKSNRQCIKRLIVARQPAKLAKGFYKK